MIDFRYHIVSLISVFLALAVGIILGAGPLQGAIGDQLTGQVEQLRDERNDLRDQLDEANVSVAQDEAFITAAGPQLVADSLKDQRVAIVSLGTVEDERYDAVAQQIDAAGATIVSRTATTESWTSSDDESYRESLDLSSFLGDLPEDATPEQRLATALATSLTESAPDDTDVRSTDATELEGLLVRAGLVKIVDEQTLPADVILLLTGPAPVVDAPTDSPTTASDTETTQEPGEIDDDVVGIEAELARAAQLTANAALVAGPTVVSGDLISTIRSTDDLAELVSTVSGTEAPALISVPLALAARLGGEVGQFGFEDSATAVIPPVVDLPPVARTPGGTPGGDTAPPTGDTVPPTDGTTTGGEG